MVEQCRVSGNYACYATRVNSIDIAHLLVIAGYIITAIWAARILYVNHMNQTRRLIARLVLVAATVWAVYLWLTLEFTLRSSLIDFLSQLAHVPVIAAFLVVMQTVRAER